MTPIDAPRNARSRRTRSALLAAARSLLEDLGFEALTMAAVAERAGVTRRAVYLHFASRADLVAALRQHVADSDGRTDSLRRVWEAPDAATALDEWALHLVAHQHRVLVERLCDEDPDPVAHVGRDTANQRDDCRALAVWLHRERRLASQWSVDAATDMLWALSSADVIDRLLNGRGQSPQCYAEHVATLLRSTFLVGPDHVPDRRSPGVRDRVRTTDPAGQFLDETRIGTDYLSSQLIWAPRTHAGRPVPWAWVEILRVQAELTRQMNANLHAVHGLTISEYEALTHLSWAPEGRLRRVELARGLHLTQGGVTRLLQGLARAGLIEDVTSQTDRRVVYAALTSAGRQRLQEAARTHVADIDTMFTARFSPEELATLADFLGRPSSVTNDAVAPRDQPRPGS